MLAEGVIVFRGLIFAVAGPAAMSRRVSPATGAIILGALSSGMAGDLVRDLDLPARRRFAAALFGPDLPVAAQHSILLELRRAHRAALRIVTDGPEAPRDTSRRETGAERFKAEILSLCGDEDDPFPPGPVDPSALEREIFAGMPRAFEAALSASGTRGPEAAVAAKRTRAAVEATVLAEISERTATPEGEMPAGFRSAFLGRDGHGWFDHFVWDAGARLRSSGAFRSLWPPEDLALVARATEGLTEAPERVQGRSGGADAGSDDARARAPRPEERLAPAAPAAIEAGPEGPAGVPGEDRPPRPLSPMALMSLASSSRIAAAPAEPWGDFADLRKDGPPPAFALPPPPRSRAVPPRADWPVDPGHPPSWRDEAPAAAPSARSRPPVPPEPPLPRDAAPPPSAPPPDRPASPSRAGRVALGVGLAALAGTAAYLASRHWDEAVAWAAKLLHGAVPPPPAMRDWPETVDVSAYAPQEAARNTRFLVQLLLHRPDERRKALDAMAREADPTAVRRGVATLDVELAPGDRVDVTLDAPGLAIEDAWQSLVWRGRARACSFVVAVPAEAAGPVVVTLRVFRQAVPAGRISFSVKVVGEAVASRTVAVGDAARPYRRAFLSYASADRAEVIRRAQALRAGRIDFFNDLLSLEPGEPWEPRLFAEIERCDLFLLFWSEAARASDWVGREIEHALACRGRSGGDTPEIMPILIDGPPPATPPASLAAIHFNDPLLYVIASADRLARGGPSPHGEDGA